ncbi:MAG TPA: primosomal protein N' [Actinomycetota bacterium]|nr:primosomal protein N' [Actinomycetota bacterium]
MSSGDSAPNAASRVSVVPLVPAWRVDRTFTYSVPEKLSGKLALGSLVRVPFGGRNVRAVVVDTDAPEAPDLLDVAALVVEQPLTPPPLDRLMEWVAERYVTPRSICLTRTIPPRVRVKVPPAEPLRAPDREVGATVAALEGGAELLAAIRGGRAGTWVVRPVPGTPRGDTIAELVAAAAGAGGAALVGVPEVHYGAPVLDALTTTWPDAARIDSSEADADRARSWLRLAAGHGLGLGGRAVVLAPTPRLRLIVLDEEHHRSYKEDRSPRYDARRVAVERARLQGAVCVLVSSTPRVESGERAAAGAWGSVAPRRADRRAARPVVEVADVPEDRALSPLLHDRIGDVLRDGGRVALLVPRRGFARTLWCATCRRSLRCPRCEAGVTFDRSPPRVRCPRCGFAAAPPDACPSCGGTEWRFLGAGSERLAEQLAKSFPHAAVRRVDPDTLAENEPEPMTEPGIYVTTWIGTKPVLRPDASLVGVLDADSLLRRPDWRAAEEGYQALAAMAEWAGPASAGGRLVLQTAEPAHHAVQAVVRGDYDFFLERELEARRELGYPPYSELVKLSARGPEAARLIEDAGAVCRAARARVLGPITARVPGTQETELQTLVKCRDALAVTPGLRGILASAPAGSRLRVDVDPR